ncbi:protein NETWORKED 2D-like [Oryza brachyantha]|uniref:protein NETWORKED 2D-like n=1 Tax=Oryza brachyantha TaxID=4533 RepID=UPI001ADB37DA|nr:protein NETWORKED 2D-like [Oryza brachyantha]
MLQRAASNAYSWWWASHIRTTQSKWLDANLQEMETRVKIMLKLLGEEADTFGKRAEMYYRSRPEVINHVEQVYRAYRALVERYDHLSKELHKANHTIATACPEQVQYALLQEEEEEDADFPKAVTPIDSRRIHNSTVQEILKRKGRDPSARNTDACAPHMTKQNAQEEISTLQKAILVLQTEKEFVKSSYETGIAKYWEIEKQIADTQDEICRIQNEFDAHASIEDDEARALMAITALRSCQGTVAKLIKKFEELVRTAAGESEKISHLRERLYAMDIIVNPSNREAGEAGTTNMTVQNRIYPNTQAILELQPIYEKIESFFERDSESIVEEMAEKVDELVDRVVNLELKFAKQSAQTKHLKEDNDSLKDILDDLQDEMALRDDPSDLGEHLKLAEYELNRVRALERVVIEEEVLVSTAFSEVVSCVTNISNAIGCIGPKDQTSLSAAAENNVELETPSEDISTSMQREELRDMEVPTKDDNFLRDRFINEDASKVNGHDSLNGTDSIVDCTKNNEENFPTGICLIQEDLRDKGSILAGNSSQIVIPSKEIEGKIDCSTKEIHCSSSSGTKKHRDAGNDVVDNSAQGKYLKGECPPTAISHTHLLHSEILTNKCDFDENEPSVAVAVNSFGDSNEIQGLEIGGDENSITGNSFIQEGGLGYGKSLKTPGHVNLVGSANLDSLNDENTAEEIALPEAPHRCFSDADMGLDFCHADEAVYVGGLPEEDGWLIAPETNKSLHGDSKVDSSEEGGCTSLENKNSTHDLRTSVIVDAHSSSEYQEVPEVTTKSEHTVSKISHGELEKRNSKGKELAGAASTLSEPGSRNWCVNSSLKVGQKLCHIYIDRKEEKVQDYGPQKNQNQERKNHTPRDSSLVAEGNAPSWQEFLLDEIEGREAILLDNYTLLLWNYKETKRRLSELEKKNQQHLEETKVVIRELRNANSMKYVEIQSLRDLLDPSDMPPTHSKMGLNGTKHPLDTEISVLDGTNLSHTSALENASPFEAKFRSDIDALVEENLQFLVRFSMACHHMQEFYSKYQELQKGLGNFEDKKTGEPDTAAEPDPAEKNLRELKTELDVWFEQNALLDQELQLKTRYLCKFQEDIAEALRASPETDGGKFTPYEAAKFQGEVLNMQQSSVKIERELQAALKRMRELEGKVNDGLQRLNESFDLSSRRSSLVEAESSSYNSQFKHFPTRTRVPLRNFLFGAKPKKKSIFACINPTLQKQFSDL